jgi:cell wall-associated NlpC family hydrolase
MSASLDPRLNAFRPDLADRCLADRVEAPRYVDGWPAEIVIGSVPVREKPDSTSGIQTFFHHGEKIQVFETGKTHSWCQSLTDGYVGYIANESLAPVVDEGMAHFVITMGSYVYGQPDLRTGPADFLPRGSKVRVVERGLMTRNTEYLRLKGAKFIPATCLSPDRPRSADIVEAAARYLGTPYLWGGRSARGIDCSALVQNAFAEIGVAVPRDTDMQLDTIGNQVHPHSIDELQRGDLIYIPGHVVICDGEGFAIHAYGPTMMVIRQRLEEFLTHVDRTLGECIVRRYEP